METVQQDLVWLDRQVVVEDRQWSTTKAQQVVLSKYHILVVLETPDQTVGMDLDHQMVDAHCTTLVQMGQGHTTVQSLVEMEGLEDTFYLNYRIYNMHCYIKDWQLVATSEELIENGQWVSYDEVLQTDLTGRVEYIDGEIVEYKEPVVEFVETPEMKKQRVFGKFIATENIEDFDWEWIELTTNEYSQLITARDFEGDNGSQIATITKSLFKCMAIFVQMGVPVETIKTVFAQEIEMAKKVSDSRVALGLSPFELPI